MLVDDGIIMPKHKLYEDESYKFYEFKGTVSWDRFQKCWRKWTDLGLNKGRGWFLNFSKTPLIFNWNKTSVSQ